MTIQPPMVSNLLLGRLDAADTERLSPILRRVVLARGRVVMDPGQPVEAVYFPAGCVISLLQVMREGSMVEAATIGAEGAIGLEGVVAGGTAVGRGLVQVAGVAWCAEALALRRVVAERPEVMAALQRCQLSLMSQVLRSVGCGHLHSARQRIARWLLAMFDRAGVDELLLTHEFLSEILAIRRPTVSAIAGEMQQAGIVSYRRGRVVLLNRQGLIRISCDCYELSRKDDQTAPGGSSAGT
jgi:CRP-like cAMP-binding protein